MKSIAAPPPTVLAVHLGAELFGSDRMFLESVIGMQEAGQRVTVTLPTEGSLADQLRERGIAVRLEPSLVLRKSLVKPRGWPRLVRDLISNSVSGWRMLSELRPDAVYVSTVTLPLWPLLARLRGARVVTHIHEAERGTRRAVQAGILLPQLCAHTVIVNSEFTLATTRDALPRLADRMTVVYNGVKGPGPIEPLPRDLPEVLRLIFIGRLSPRKGPDVAVRALASLRERGIDAHLILLGSAFEGYEWFVDDLHRLTAELGLEQVVEFLGFEESIWATLASAHVLLAPSVADEPFGNVAVEGVLAGRAVVYSNAAGLKEAMSPYTTAVAATPGDPADLARAVASIAEDWPTIAHETATSVEAAHARHSVDGYRRHVACIVEDTVREVDGRPRGDMLGRERSSRASSPESTAQARDHGGRPRRTKGRTR